MKAIFAALFASAAVTTGFVSAPSHHRYEQTIYVRNLSSFVSNAEVRNDLPAFQAAADKDFASVWNIGARLVFTGRSAAPRGAKVITLVDKGDVKGALAYHEIVDGQPCSVVYVGTALYYRYSWTVGFTHELWEQLADPGLTRAQQAPDGTMWANEVADPVEADSDGYTRPGADGKPVLISDFVTDRWFGAQVDGPYDFMHHVQAPLALLKGGYAQYWSGFGWVVVSNFDGCSVCRSVHW